MQPTPTHRGASSVVGHYPLSFLMFCLPLALIGCRDPKVTSYQVPKEAVAELPASAPAHAQLASNLQSAVPAPIASSMPSAAAPGASDPHALQTAGGQALSWLAPSGWQPKQGSAMRKATFVVAGAGDATAELAISAFPGDVGGEIANVNRWRGQVGLPPISDSDAVASIDRLDANGLKIGLVDVVGSTSAPTRLLGAFVPYDGATWFFKLLGPDTVVASQKTAFIEFLKTIKPSASATP